MYAIKITFNPIKVPIVTKGSVETPTINANKNLRKYLRG